jgi:hypothetical protein
VAFEVRRDGRAIPIGENRSAPSLRKVPPARAALAAAVAGGWFAREEGASFVFARHYADVEAMLAYYRERDPEVTLDAGMLARARALLADAGGTVVSRAQIHAERLRRRVPHGTDEGREQ